MVVEFRKNPAPPTPITPSDSPVDSVESIRFLGTIISQDLKWEVNIISLTNKAHQRMYFLCQDFKRGPNHPLSRTNDTLQSDFVLGSGSVPDGDGGGEDGLNDGGV